MFFSLAFRRRLLVFLGLFQLGLVFPGLLLLFLFCTRGVRTPFLFESLLLSLVGFLNGPLLLLCHRFTVVLLPDFKDFVH